MLHPGVIIENHYRIIKLLGEGGMSRVYLAEDIATGTLWAVKETREAGEIQSTQQDRYNSFLKEVAILSTIRHPNLPLLDSYFAAGSHYYTVEEYIEGPSLESYLQHTLPEELEVIDWALTLCSVLGLLHKNGIIFRDLKPANIMLKPDGTIKLIDFDIARHYKPGLPQDTTLLGTPGYAAPETYGKAQSDPRSDIYSLGATLHHLLTGKNPQDEPFTFKPVRALRAGVSPELEAIIEKAVQMKAEERYQNTGTMEKVLINLRKKSVAAIPLHPLHRAGGFMKAFFNMPDTIAHRAGASSSKPQEIKGALIRPPAFTLRPFQQWSTFTGKSHHTFPDTYLYYPEKVTEVSVTMPNQRVRRGHDLNVEFHFTVPWHPPAPQSYKPRTLILQIHLLMPLDQNYADGYGAFAPLPGRIIKFALDSPNCFSGDSKDMRIDVVHHNSYVKGTLKWRPTTTRPPLKYDAGAPWKGPRFLIHAACPEYSWQYTRGFITG